MYIYIYMILLTIISRRKQDRYMERTLLVKYPVLRQNKGVLLNTFVKNHSH